MLLPLFLATLRIAIHSILPKSISVHQRFKINISRSGHNNYLKIWSRPNRVNVHNKTKIKQPKKVKLKITFQSFFVKTGFCQVMKIMFLIYYISTKVNISELCVTGNIYYR